MLLRRAATGPADPYRHVTDRPAGQPAVPPSISAPDEPPGPHAVSYEVTGTGRASVLYTKSASVTGIVSVTLPWRATLTLDAGEVTLRALTPQTPPEGFGCRLVIDGVTVVDSTPDESDAVTCQLSPA
ncbi:MmpS family transport accessory protein [Micromonospora rhizosphaerae]|nr:MmpS family transport accessory protein [Micromonospora rhizosphaerae]